MKTLITIQLENGVMSYAANCSNTELIALLESAKHMAIRQALGGGSAGRPPEPGQPARAGMRAPGLEVRRIP